MSLLISVIESLNSCCDTKRPAVSFSQRKFKNNTSIRHCPLAIKNGTFRHAMQIRHLSNIILPYRETKFTIAC